VILTLDLGTSVTKAALWSPDGLVALAEVAVVSDHPEPGTVEQRPADWWDSVVAACAALRDDHPDRLREVSAVGCTGARQTFGLFDASGAPLGPGIVWSDHRADREAARLVTGDWPGPGVGPPLDGASVPAKLAWLAAHRADDLARCAWVLSPRDLVGWRLTGTVATDPTLASLTGCYRTDGTVLGSMAGSAADRLPPVVPSERVAGTVATPVAGELGLSPGVPVVLGAGDRQSEVVGTGATAAVPMVSWGTTANVSLPVGDLPVPVPAGVVATRATDGGWLLEGGLSAAGSLLAWLGRLCGRPPAELAVLAATSPPGARGVTAVPWLGGARAPWWRPEAGAAFVGLSGAHGPADLARAVLEGVALDVLRCLETMADRRPPGPAPSALGLAGGGGATPAWGAVLAGTTGLPVRHRRSGQAASAGAALLAARAVGETWDLGTLDPVAGTVVPGPGDVDRYAELRPHADAVASSLLGPGAPPTCG
jgi:xylulokinase